MTSIYWRESNPHHKDFAKMINKHVLWFLKHKIECSYDSRFLSNSAVVDAVVCHSESPFSTVFTPPAIRSAAYWMLAAEWGITLGGMEMPHSKLGTLPVASWCGGTKELPLGSEHPEGRAEASAATEWRFSFSLYPFLQYSLPQVCCGSSCLQISASWSISQGI